MDIPILLYHSIIDSVSPHFSRWAVRPRQFDRHMAYLLENEFTPIPLAEIVAAISNPTRRLPRKAVGITFDDGYADFYENAFPILQKYHIPTTVYVVAGYVGGASEWLEAEGEGDHPMMAWEQLREIAEAGVEVGAHTLHHYYLDTLAKDAAYREIMGSKTILEENLACPVNSFAYPHGYHSKEITHMVKQAGFSSACAVKHGLSSTEDDRFALARIIVSRDTEPETLGDLLAGKGLMRVTREERLRTKMWRFVRRAMYRLRGSELPATMAKGGGPLYGNPTEHR